MLYCFAVLWSVMLTYEDIKHFLNYYYYMYLRILFSTTKTKTEPHQLAPSCRFPKFLCSPIPIERTFDESLFRCFCTISTIFDMLLSAHRPCRLLHNCVHHCVSFSICVFVFSVRERVPSALTHYIGNFRAMAATERVERAKGHVWLSVSGSVCVYMCVLWHY